jgi:hypothetical protein
VCNGIKTVIGNGIILKDETYSEVCNKARIKVSLSLKGVISKAFSFSNVL